MVTGIRRGDETIKTETETYKLTERRSNARHLTFKGLGEGAGGAETAVGQWVLMAALHPSEGSNARHLAFKGLREGGWGC